MNDFDRIACVIRYLDEHQADQPDLTTLASLVGLSPSHFHRLFTRWAAVTPKTFLQCLTLTHVKRMLQSGSSVLDAALEAGLSGPGRLHDLCVRLEAASPGEVKSGGAGWTIRTGFAASPFGTCLVGSSPRGICHLSFPETRRRDGAEAALQEDWPRAKIVWDFAAEALMRQVFTYPTADHPQASLRLLVRGTPFQVQVWRALLTIPCGGLSTYGRVATAIGDHQSARAVGSALAQNRIAYLIPCHRVIRETAVIGQYRWGATRKKAMLAWEAVATAESLYF